MNSTFCTDLVSLFVNHIFDCDSCFDKIAGLAVMFFAVVAFFFLCISVAVEFFGKLFSKIFDRVCYRKKYNELESEFEHLNDSYSELLCDYHTLCLKYDDLEKEYYHTCN